MILAYSHVFIEKSEGFAKITLNRPEVLNACNSETHREVQRALDECEADNDIKSIIFSGMGRAFCAGSDLREVGQLTGGDARRYLRLDFSTKNRIATCAKPVIAALHGHVAGGGFELALACDIRIVADDVLFSLPEIGLGTIPGSGGLQRLPQVVGMGIAKEWAMTGRRIDADEAFRRGLANSVHRRDDLMDAAEAMARNLATKSSIALSLAKTALDPEPPPEAGMVGVYHMLAAQACHDDPSYKSSVGKYSSSDAKNAEKK